jgi:hypothetical protein
MGYDSGYVKAPRNHEYFSMSRVRILDSRFFVLYSLADRGEPI